MRKIKFLIAIIIFYLKGKKPKYASFVKFELLKPEPTLEFPVSQLVTSNQFKSPIYSKWCKEMNEIPILHRKQWEYVYVLEVLAQKNKLTEGVLGLGFGVGTEPLPAVFAKYGCKIIATDQNIENAKLQGWTKTNEHSSGINLLKFNDIISLEEFNEKVIFENADMNLIPEKYINKFDFVWSCCSLEHIGSINHSIDFIINSISCLKKGGIAVHTTEFNLSSNYHTLETGPSVYFRKIDIELLEKKINEMGCFMYPINYNPGTEKLDQYIDLPPYKKLPHLKLLHMYITTSIGIIIEKK